MTEFLIAVAAVVVVLIFTERIAWRQIARLRAGLRSEVIEQAGSAYRLHASILDLREAWRLAAEDPNPNQRASLTQVENDLRQLISNQLESDPAPPARALLEKLQAEFDSLSRLIQNPSMTSGTARIGPQLARMLELGNELRVANDAAAGAILREADRSLTRLQRFLFLSLLGLLLCGAVVLVLTYRRMVRPLRSSLRESRTLIERQEKLASLGVFAAGIAHEIRNPITAIKVRLFTLQGCHPAGSEEHEDLQVIESEIDRLERIVQEFLNFARPAEPDLVTLPVDSFLREIHGLLRPVLAKRGIRFELDLGADDPVRIDPEKMKQVLLNFVQNAADSIEGEGAVTVRSRHDRQKVDGRALPVVAIEISDTGKGVPAEVQQRLFDPFFTTKEQGTGLGLPIAARIVEKHGGLIQYHSQVGQGTTFSILLPPARS